MSLGRVVVVMLALAGTARAQPQPVQRIAIGEVFNTCSLEPIAIRLHAALHRPPSRSARYAVVADGAVPRGCPSRSADQLEACALEVGKARSADKVVFGTVTCEERAGERRLELELRMLDVAQHLASRWTGELAEAEATVPRLEVLASTAMDRLLELQTKGSLVIDAGFVSGEVYEGRRRLATLRGGRAELLDVVPGTHIIAIRSNGEEIRREVEVLAARRIELPVKFPPCDFDAAFKRAGRMLRERKVAAALSALKDAYACNPASRVAVGAAMISCGQRDRSSAVTWFPLVDARDRPRLVQSCMRLGIDLRFP